MTQPHPKLETLLRGGVLIGIVGFLAALALAMACYPGGNFWDRSQPGYDFWLNFLCDLLHDPALNGESNGLSARLAELAMGAFAFGLCCYWMLVGALIPTKKWAAASRGLGIAAALGLLATTLLPSDISPVLHTTAVLAAGPAGLGAVLIAMLVLPLPSGLTLAKVSGIGMLLFGVLAVVLYAWQLAPSVEASRLLPASQKLAAIMAVAWIVAVYRLPRKGTNRPQLGRAEGLER